MEGISLHNSNYQWQIVFDWCLAFPSKCLILLPLRRLQYGIPCDPNRSCFLFARSIQFELKNINRSVLAVTI